MAQVPPCLKGASNEIVRCVSCEVKQMADTLSVWSHGWKGTWQIKVCASEKVGKGSEGIEVGQPKYTSLKLVSSLARSIIHPIPELWNMDIQVYHTHNTTIVEYGEHFLSRSWNSTICFGNGNQHGLYYGMCELIWIVILCLFSNELLKNRYDC